MQGVVRQWPGESHGIPGNSSGSSSFSGSGTENCGKGSHPITMPTSKGRRVDAPEPGQPLRLNTLKSELSFTLPRSIFVLGYLGKILRRTLLRARPCFRPRKAHDSAAGRNLRSAHRAGGVRQGTARAPPSLSPVLRGQTCSLVQEPQPYLLLETVLSDQESPDEHLMTVSELGAA